MTDHTEMLSSGRIWNKDKGEWVIRPSNNSIMNGSFFNKVKFNKNTNIDNINK